MKNYRNLVLLLSVFMCVFGAAAVADENPPAAEDPNQLFYTGNHYYQKQDYVNAVEQYVKLLDMGLESGPLYYNIGNGFLKLGKIGYALLCYEKARRLTPHDSDLKSNLAYARSLIDETAQDEAHGNPVTRLLRKMYSDINLGSLAAITAISYIILIAMAALLVLNPILGRKLRFLVGLLGIVFVFNALAFCVRYYGEVVVRHGIIVKKGVEAKYEPIDKSTTFYQLKEGSGVIILKTKEGWRQVRRPDGKTGWISKDSAEEI